MTWAIVELRIGDVPVKAVSLQVQQVGVGQQFGQMLGNRFTIFLGDTDGNDHVLLLLEIGTGSGSFVTAIQTK